eukprot:1118459-Rhodomonas_salina.1
MQLTENEQDIRTPQQAMPELQTSSAGFQTPNFVIDSSYASPGKLLNLPTVRSATSCSVLTSRRTFCETKCCSSECAELTSEHAQSMKGNNDVPDNTPNFAIDPRYEKDRPEFPAVVKSQEQLSPIDERSFSQNTSLSVMEKQPGAVLLLALCDAKT